MEKLLVITEKPSVAKDIARVLNIKQKGEGCIYSEQYIISWAIGHMLTLKEPEDYDKSLKQWKLPPLPFLPQNIELKPIKKTFAQLKILKELMQKKDVTSIICATDAGREGELIFRYIYEYTRCKKPVQRLWISSMTDQAILTGFKNLKPISEYDNLYNSAKCRSHADWLVGINSTRAYTLVHNTLLSIGRVQTPTLALIVNRQNQIDNFKPQDYWELHVNFVSTPKNEEYAAKWVDTTLKEHRFDKLDEAQTVQNKIKSQNGKISSINSKENKKLPPLLYDLTELQRECNRFFGYSAKQTLSTAQQLYEKYKLITYPRTDSRHISTDMIPKLHLILNNLSKTSAYESFSKYILSLEKLPINNRIVDNQKIKDHHAIIPTEKAPKHEGLSVNEKNVYNLIVLRFLAVFYPPYIEEITTVITIVNDENFLSKGAKVLQLGYKNVESTNAHKDEDELKILPNLKIGDIVTQTNSKIEAKKTQPPKLYTEATLLSSMENAGKFVEDEELKHKLKESGLGTPATRAAIIERLLNVEYIERKGKALLPTQKAMLLIESLPQQIIDPATTGRWEKGLSSIANGNMNPIRFMDSIHKFVNFLVEDAKSASNSSKVSFPIENKPTYVKSKKANSLKLGICPACKSGKILENTKAYYCSAWKANCKFTIWKNSTQIYHYEPSPSDIKSLLKGEKPTVKIILPDTNEKATATLTLDIANSINFLNVIRFENTKILKK